MAMRKMRREHIFEERPVHIASDGWAYDRPSVRSGRVWRYPHDGGTQTRDSEGQRVAREDIPDVWPELIGVFRLGAASRRVAQS